MAGKSKSHLSVVSPSRSLYFLHTYKLFIHAFEILLSWGRMAGELLQS